jgi:hypothetical protein
VASQQPAAGGSRLSRSEPAVTDRQGIGFGWLQNAWLLHARLKIHRGGIDAPSVASTENPRAGSLRRRTSGPSKKPRHGNSGHSSRATPTGFCDSRGTEVLWVGVCAPHGWNLMRIGVSIV